MSAYELTKLFQAWRDARTARRAPLINQDYAIELTLCGTKDQHRRMVHNLAQHALSLKLVAQEIDPHALLDLLDDTSPINIENNSRTEECTLAMALAGLPFRQAHNIVLALTTSEPRLLTHPGVVGWVKANQTDISLLYGLPR